MNELDFQKISKAIQSSYHALNDEEFDNHNVIQQFNHAQDEWLNALSHATSVDKDYLRYVNHS